MLWRIQLDNGGLGYLEPGTGHLFADDGAAITAAVCYSTTDTAPAQPAWYVAPVKSPLADVDTAALMRAAEGAIQERLDAQAQSMGYDGILSAVSYAPSTHPKFGAEGRALLAWRDACWTVAYTVMADVLAGKSAPPTVEQLMAQVPAFQVV